MTRGSALALATIALLIATRTAGAQQASVAVGAVVPVGGLSASAANGVDVDLQVRTEPMIGPLSLRIDIGYDFLGSKGPAYGTTITAQSIGVTGNLGSMFYWSASPGYYQTSEKTDLFGHRINALRTYFGAAASLGVNFRVIRWDGFLEASAVRLFSPGPALAYVPLRFGIRL